MQKDEYRAAHRHYLANSEKLRNYKKKGYELVNCTLQHTDNEALQHLVGKDGVFCILKLGSNEHLSFVTADREASFRIKLEKQGYIKKEDKKGRTLKVIKGSDGKPVKQKSNKNFYTQKELVDVPIIGKITAGQPILAVENVTDTFPIPIDFIGNCESFMLTVRGESMIEAGILDGDYILVRKQNTANNGEIVVALIGEEATVKTFYKEDNYFRFRKYMQEPKRMGCKIGFR